MCIYSSYTQSLYVMTTYANHILNISTCECVCECLFDSEPLKNVVLHPVKNEPNLRTGTRLWWPSWRRTTGRSIRWTFWDATRAVTSVTGLDHPPAAPTSHVIVTMDGLLSFAVDGRSRSSTSALAAVMMPPLPPPALLAPPTLSFFQFPATPLGSRVLSERLLFTQPHRCQPIGGLWSRCHVTVGSQSQTPTTAHFLQGKYIHRPWMFLFLISSARKKKEEESKAATFAAVP